MKGVQTANDGLIGGNTPLAYLRMTPEWRCTLSLTSSLLSRYDSSILYTTTYNERYQKEMVSFFWDICFIFLCVHSSMNHSKNLEPHLVLLLNLWCVYFDNPTVLTTAISRDFSVNYLLLNGSAYIYLHPPPPIHTHTHTHNTHTHTQEHVHTHVLY